MPNLRSLAAAGLAAALLSLATACAGGTATHSVSLRHTGTPEIFRYAAGGRDLETVVLGNPTGAPQHAFESAVVAAMQGAPFGPQTRFTTEPSASARPGYRVVMLFDGRSELSGAAACRRAESAKTGSAAAGQTTGEGAGTVKLQAAFCYRERVLSEARVDTGAVAAAQDPALQNAVRQAVLALFPQRDPERHPQGEILPEL